MRRFGTDPKPKRFDSHPGRFVQRLGGGGGCGICAAALGSQTVGSILRPAAYCGAYGFKPSHGALSLDGVHPLCRDTDHLGVLAGSLEDAWRVAFGCARNLPAPVLGAGIARATLPPPIVPRRIGLLETEGFSEISAETREALLQLVSALIAQGLEVVDAEAEPAVAFLEQAVRGAGDLASELLCGGMQYPIRMYQEDNSALLGAKVLQRLAQGEGISPSVYRTLTARQAAIREAFAVALERVDVVLTLSSSGPAPIGLESTGSRSFLAPASVAGVPAVTLPLLQIEQLPQGVQLIGRYGRDLQLVRIASWFDWRRGALAARAA